jgi:hypothetical protein
MSIVSIPSLPDDFMQPNSARLICRRNVILVEEYEMPSCRDGANACAAVAAFSNMTKPGGTKPQQRHPRLELSPAGLDESLPASRFQEHIRCQRQFQFYGQPRPWCAAAILSFEIAVKIV